MDSRVSLQGLHKLLRHQHSGSQASHRRLPSVQRQVRVQHLASHQHSVQQQTQVRRSVSHQPSVRPATMLHHSEQQPLQVRPHHLHRLATPHSHLHSLELQGTTHNHHPSQPQISNQAVPSDSHRLSALQTRHLLSRRQRMELLLSKKAHSASLQHWALHNKAHLSVSHHHSRELHRTLHSAKWPSRKATLSAPQLRPHLHSHRTRKHNLLHSASHHSPLNHRHS